METNKISNKIVKAAVEAWQQGNSALWLSFFTEDAKLLDDGNIRDFKTYFKFYIDKEGRIYQLAIGQADY